jgi:hypothetical protein
MKAVKLAKIPHIRLHDFRRAFATRLVRSGVDIVTVQHLLGHSNILMTSRYAHSDTDAKMDAVKRLEFAGDRRFLMRTGTDTERLFDERSESRKIFPASKLGL